MKENLPESEPEVRFVFQESFDLVVFDLSGIEIKGSGENLIDSHGKNRVREELRQHMYMRDFRRRKIGRETGPLKVNFSTSKIFEKT